MGSVQAFDRDGRLIQLGQELGRGGEGSVYDIRGSAGNVAKIYHTAVGSEHAAKLVAMVNSADARLLHVAAWPTSTIHRSDRAIVGFLMPKIYGHRPVFQLYGPKLRLQEFPRADWRFLIHAGANAARAFATIHAAGHIIGDVNHGNLVVGQDATVRLIDCDSFQVTLDRRTWRCKVGVGTHQPPELQNVSSYENIERTFNHDNFGLAVLIFQLLCIARHPFSGRHIGAGEPPSIEEAIARSRYAYSRERSRTAMEPPIGSLPIDALPPEIQMLFEKAFSPDSIGGGRPTPDQWTSALQSLSTKLRRCYINQGHYYLSGRSFCPWCDIEAKSGIRLFPALFVQPPGGVDGMVALWQQVAALKEPASLPPLPDYNAQTMKPAAEALEISIALREPTVLAYGLAAIATIIMFTIIPFPSALFLMGVFLIASYVAHMDKFNKNEFKLRLAEAKGEWNAFAAEWSEAELGKSFGPQMENLIKLKAKYDDLQKKREERLRSLADQSRQKQLHDYLDQFPIARSKIVGLGDTKMATLSAYNIYTAADVVAQNILAVPGFGEVMTGKLVKWRKQIEIRFVFNPNMGVSQADRIRVEQEFARERNQIETEIAAGLAQLRIMVAASENRRISLEQRAAELIPKLAQISADAKAVPTTLKAKQRVIAFSIALAAASICINLVSSQLARSGASLP